MRRIRFLAATAAAAALIAGAATLGSSAAASGDDDDNGTSRLFGALLTGAAEVPGPGDRDGSAAAVVRISLPSARVCVLGFAHHQIQTPNLFHIHAGTPDVAGPVVVDFTPLLPSGEGCVQADRKVVRGIFDDPGAYYFNVHNVRFPAGAVRGTLASL
jgi:hypothetical protein